MTSKLPLKGPFKIARERRLEARPRGGSTSQNRVPVVGPCLAMAPDRDGVTVSTRTKRVVPARLSAVIV